MSTAGDSSVGVVRRGGTCSVNRTDTALDGPLRPASRADGATRHTAVSATYPRMGPTPRDRRHEAVLALQFRERLSAECYRFEILGIVHVEDHAVEAGVQVLLHLLHHLIRRTDHGVGAGTCLVHPSLLPHLLQLSFRLGL